MIRKTIGLLLFAGVLLTAAGPLHAEMRTHRAPETAAQTKKPEPAFSVFLKTAFFGLKLPAAEKNKSRIFVLLLFGIGSLLIVFRITGAELPPPFGALAAVFYSASMLLYGFWVLHLSFGLPSGWTFPSVIMGISGGVLAASVLIGMDHRSRTRRTLAPGYRKCPYCGEAVVQLALECSACHRKIPA